MGSTGRIISILVLVSLLSGAAAARDLDEPEEILAIVAACVDASSGGEVREILREARDNPYPGRLGGGAMSGSGTLTQEHGLPVLKARLSNLDAGLFFRNVVGDSYIFDDAVIRGRTSLEMEIRGGASWYLTGTWSFEDVDISWPGGTLTLSGIEGDLPIFLIIGEPIPSPPISFETQRRPPRERNLTLERIEVGHEALSENASAVAAYRNRVLRLDRIAMDLLGGEALGTIVLDHRTSRWRMAAIMEIGHLDVGRLTELVGDVPILAGRVEGAASGRVQIALSYPDIVRFDGRFSSDGPGRIHISESLRDGRYGGNLPEVFEYSRFDLRLRPSAESGDIEGLLRIDRRTARTLLEVLRGAPVVPYRVEIRFPLLALIQAGRSGAR